LLNKYFVMYLKGIKFIYHQNKLVVAFHETIINIYFSLMQLKVASWELKLESVSLFIVFTD